MWRVLLILPKGARDSQLSDRLHNSDNLVSLFDEAKLRTARGEGVLGVLQLEAVGLDNEALLQLEAALDNRPFIWTPGGLALPGTAALVTEAANALVRPLAPEALPNEAPAGGPA